MKDLKQYKANYERYEVAQEIFEAVNLEDAKSIAELKRPDGFETSHVSETAQSITKPFFETLGEILNPNSKENDLDYYWCDKCEKDIHSMNLVWRNSTPVCPYCETMIKL